MNRKFTATATRKTPLVLKNWSDWFVTRSPNDVNLFHSDSSDRILICPPFLGQGYIQEIVLREDVTLMILDYTLDYDLFLNLPGEENCLEFEFQLAGADAGYSFVVPYLGGKEVGVKRRQKRFFKVEVIFRRPSLTTYFQDFMERLPPQTYRIADQLIQFMHRYRKGRSISTTTEILNQMFRGEIALDPHITFEEIISDALYAETIVFKYSNRHPITSRMEQVIGQILSCPYQGAIRRAYLEKKALKLVALRLEAMMQPRLPKVDLHYIDQAASILREKVVNPPTVEVLARQVNTNRLKLNQGFHQVYGTTPFGYLRDYRVMQARRLLMTSELSVEQVATRVGYTSRSRFATAFRKSVGINPKAFQMQAWECLSYT